MAAFYRDRDWRFAWGNYAFLLAATYTVAGTPAPHKRAVALVLCLAAMWLNTAVWRPTRGWVGSPRRSSSSCWRATRPAMRRRGISSCQRNDTPVPGN